MDKIIEPVSYKKMAEKFSKPAHTYGKLREGVGAGYQLTFIDIKLTNVKVGKTEKDGDGFDVAKFTADIVPGKYGWYADHPYWTAASSGNPEPYNFDSSMNPFSSKAVITGGKVEGTCDDGGTAWRSEGSPWSEKQFIDEIESEDFIIQDSYSGGWVHSPMTDTLEWENEVRPGYEKYIDDTPSERGNLAVIEKISFKFDPDWVADYEEALDYAENPDEYEEDEWDDADDDESPAFYDDPDTGRQWYESRMREYSSSRSIKNYKPQHDFKKTKKYQDDEGLVGDIVKIVGVECGNSAVPASRRGLLGVKYDFSKRPEFKDYKKKGLEQEFSDFKNALGHKGEIVKTLPENSHVKKSFIIKVLDGPSKDKEFEFYPGEFYVIKGRLDSKYRFSNYEESKKESKAQDIKYLKYLLRKEEVTALDDEERWELQDLINKYGYPEEYNESKKLSERTHRIEHEGHVIGYCEPGEDEYLFYSNGKSATRPIGFISAEDGKVYLKGHLAKEVYEAFPDYTELKKPAAIKEAMIPTANDPDILDFVSTFKGTLGGSPKKREEALEELKQVGDSLVKTYPELKGKSPAQIARWCRSVLDGTWRPLDESYEDDDFYVNPEDYDKEGTYDEYLRYCAATNGDPMSEEEWRWTTGIHESKKSSESKLEEDSFTSKVRQDVVEINNAKNQVNQDVDALNNKVNKITNDIVSIAVNHRPAIRESVEKTIEVDFPITVSVRGQIKVNDAKKLLRKLAADRKLRVNTTYHVKDSEGNETSWDFERSSDPYYPYQFSCEIADDNKDRYNCLYLDRRRSKVDLKNSQWESYMVESNGQRKGRITESNRLTHKIVLKPENSGYRLTYADKLRFHSLEDAQKKLDDLNAQIGYRLAGKGLHLEIEEIPQSTRPRNTRTSDPDYQNPFEVGDILEGDFGYSMILPAWVEVIAKTNKTVTVRELKDKVISHDGYGQAGTKMPIPGEYKKSWNGDYREKKCVVKKGYNRVPDSNPKKNYFIDYDEKMFQIWDGEASDFDTYD